jgi:hypothetical protein
MRPGSAPEWPLPVAVAAVVADVAGVVVVTIVAGRAVVVVVAAAPAVGTSLVAGRESGPRPRKTRSLGRCRLDRFTRELCLVCGELLAESLRSAR